MYLKNKVWLTILAQMNILKLSGLKVNLLGFDKEGKTCCNNTYACFRLLKPGVFPCEKSPVSKPIFLLKR